MNVWVDRFRLSMPPLKVPPGILKKVTLSSILDTPSESETAESSARTSPVAQRRQVAQTYSYTKGTFLAPEVGQHAEKSQSTSPPLVGELPRRHTAGISDYNCRLS